MTRRDYYRILTRLSIERSIERRALSLVVRHGAHLNFMLRVCIFACYRVLCNQQLTDH